MEVQVVISWRKVHTCSQGHFWAYHDQPDIVVLTVLSQNGMVANGHL